MSHLWGFLWIILKLWCLITTHTNGVLMQMCNFSSGAGKPKRKCLYSPPSSSLPSAFRTHVSDQERASVSIKLCSVWDDIYVRGQLIFSHCNYRRRSMKCRGSCSTPGSTDPAGRRPPPTTEELSGGTAPPVNVNNMLKDSNLFHCAVNVFFSNLILGLLSRNQNRLDCC